MVVGKKQNHRDQDIALTSLLETARRNNVCLNYDKHQYKKTEVNFFSEIYITSGQKPAQTKVFVRTSMPKPNCKNQVQSFIGMINYLSKFFTRLSEFSEHFRELAKDKVPLNWGPEHQETCNLIRKEIAGAPILAYYSPRKQMTLQPDASSKGLGASLLQEGKLVHFMSKILTKAQKGT